ncbi:MAG TPA: insulinase family protein, partial [Thermoanaerobaculia bacterium]|nr:insulinase family protein [Thermoanaerobaculia bacterium]
LVYDQQIAISAGGQAIILQDPGVFFFFAILQAGQTPEAGEKSLAEEVERLKSQPVSAEELVKAKNQLIAGLVFGRETAHDKAEAAGYAKVILGDVGLVNSQLALYQKVTAADVQRVAQKYFTLQNRTVVSMLPEAMRAKALTPQGEEAGQ